MVRPFFSYLLLPPLLSSLSHSLPCPTSPARRVDRIRGEGKVHLCRGARAHYRSQAPSLRREGRIIRFRRPSMCAPPSP